MIKSVHPLEEDLPLWKLNKANWEKFRSLCLKYHIQNDITYSADHFTQKVITIAKKSLSHTTQPLIDRTEKKCTDAIWLQYTILQKFHTEPTTSNLISFKSTDQMDIKPSNRPKETSGKIT